MLIAHFHTENKSEKFAPELFMGGGGGGKMHVIFTHKRLMGK